MSKKMVEEGASKGLSISKEKGKLIESHPGGLSRKPPKLKLEASAIQAKKTEEVAESNSSALAGPGSMAPVPEAHDFKTQEPVTRAAFALELLKSEAGFVGDWRLNRKSAEKVMEAASAFTSGERPYDAITRAEAATMLVRFAGLEGTSYEGKVGYFGDLYPGWHAGWVFDNAHVARMYGLFQGTDQNKFLPEETLDSATMSVLVGRVKNVGLKSVEEQTGSLAVPVLDKPASTEDTWDGPTNERIGKLHEDVQVAARQFVNIVKAELGITLRISDGFRSIEEQNALYNKGRRGIEGERKVTDAKGGQSFHNYGLALDVVVMNGRELSGTAITPEIAEIGKKLGFEWGGDWESFVDRPHFQMTFGKPLSHYQNQSK